MAEPAPAAGEGEERIYDTVKLEEMEFEEADELYTFQCPCGDLFEITVAQIEAGESIAKCPSCSLQIRVVMPNKETPPAESSPAG